MCLDHLYYSRSQRVSSRRPVVSYSIHYIPIRLLREVQANACQACKDASYCASGALLILECERLCERSSTGSTLPGVCRQSPARGWAAYGRMLFVPGLPASRCSQGGPQAPERSRVPPGLAPVAALAVLPQCPTWPVSLYDWTVRSYLL